MPEFIHIKIDKFIKKNMHNTMEMVKLQYDANKQFKITLPRQLILAKKWKKGQQLCFELDGEGNIVIKNEKTR